MLQQRTITNPIKAMGVGLHSGKKVILELLPAPADSGINFIRSDLEPNVGIPAIFEHVGDTTLSTTLYKEGSRIATIEPRPTGTAFCIAIPRIFKSCAAS